MAQEKTAGEGRKGDVIENAVLDTAHADHDVLWPNWDYLEDCYIGGGNIMSAKDDVYLYQRSKEKDARYSVRKKRATYYNKCAQVIKTFLGHMWRKRPQRILPKRLEAIQDNVDRRGTNIDFYQKRITEWSMTLGMFYKLVDYPKNESRLGNRSVAEEKRLGLRPYFVRIDPRNFLDWRFTTTASGKRVLDWISFREKKEVMHAAFEGMEIEWQYKVYYRDHVEVWEYMKDKKGKKTNRAICVDDYTNSLGEVPLVAYPCDEIRFGVAKAAIFDIAPLNIELYNKHSDKDNAEFYTSFPVPVFTGYKEEEDKSVILSEDHGIRFSNPQSNFRWEEFSGKAIESLRQTEIDIKMEMFDIAMKQVRNLSNQRQTSESKRMDRMDADSDLMARSIEYAQAEEKAWRYAGMWMNLPDTELDKISVTYNTDFNVDQIRADLIKALLDMMSMDLLSKRTFWQIGKREELLPQDFDEEEEKKQIEKERMEAAVPDFASHPAETGTETDGEEEEEEEA